MVNNFALQYVAAKNWFKIYLRLFKHVWANLTNMQVLENTTTFRDTTFKIRLDAICHKNDNWGVGSQPPTPTPLYCGHRTKERAAWSKFHYHFSTILLPKVVVDLASWAVAIFASPGPCVSSSENTSMIIFYCISWYVFIFSVFINRYFVTRVLL